MFGSPNILPRWRTQRNLQPLPHGEWWKKPPASCQRNRLHQHLRCHRDVVMPLPLCPGERYTDFCLYPSSQEALLPKSQKTVNSQVHAFEKFIRQLENLSGLTVIPPYPKNIKQACKSLARLGFHLKAAGVSRRPVIPKAAETVKIVDTYLAVARTRGSLDKPLCVSISDDPLVEFQLLPENSPKERYNYAQVIRKRNAKKWIASSSILVHEFIQWSISPVRLYRILWWFTHFSFIGVWNLIS